MTVNQISIFLENKPESLSQLTDVLAKNNINMRALSLADTSDFGIARIITDDCAAAEEVLKANDYVVKTTGVIAIEIPDEAGSLNKILKLLAENGRNIEYMYGFTGRKTNSACMILRCTNMQKTEEILEGNGIHTISQDELKNI